MAPSVVRSEQPSKTERGRRGDGGPEDDCIFPRRAFGPALNSVGIAQACRDLGHRAVFICDPGFTAQNGKPALILPYVWDGHDNATRVQETGHGLKLHRYDWSDAELAQAIEILLGDTAMRAKLAATSAQMQARNDPQKAARLLDALLKAQD